MNEHGFKQCKKQLKLGIRQMTIYIHVHCQGESPHPL